MEDEIDVRKYVAVLIRQWKWIVGLAVVGGLAALIVSSLIRPTYEAPTLVVITRPRYQLQFDPRIESVTDPQLQPYKAFPELAMSDELLAKVIDKLGGTLKSDERDLAVFRGRLSARAGQDPSLVRLAVTGTDPGQAQAIANTWADTYVAYTNELYQQRSSDAAFFEQQVGEVRQKLEKAEQALIDFQARNPINVVSAQLSSKQSSLSNYLAADHSITLIIQDARSLQQQLAQQSASGPASLADQLSALYLQVDALNTKANVPIQLQIGGGGTLANRTVSEQAALLDSLVKALQDKSIEIQKQIKALEPDILALQRTLQEGQTELDRLTRDRDVARETFLALTRKLDETNVAAQDASGQVRLASQAALPTEPISPRKGLNAVLGGLLGLLVGTAAAFVVDTRRPAAEKSPARAAHG
jgi:uncharacterized protein involved in exopolysaccharide biosynthesis